MKFITSEEAMCIKAIKEYLPLQAGDVEEITNTSALKEWINYEPNTKLELGINKFVSGLRIIIYKDHY